ncbi:hypothetical protein [Streptomyces sp. NPDC089919]|uniref:hypothetical protein n=1 Tax=Streptomyces sp. NPDC089919 TaxID=3155188 RepID=UPI0034209EE7
MSDISAATWTTHVHGERTELPTTIDGIRATLPENQRPAFNAEIGATPADELMTSGFRAQPLPARNFPAVASVGPCPVLETCRRRS